MTHAAGLHIGLIGGIGVAATVVYYQRLTAEVARRGAMDLTIAHTPDINVLIRNNLADRRAEQAAEYAPLIDRLKAAGCDCAAITSLGGHFCFAETAALSSSPSFRRLRRSTISSSGKASGVSGFSARGW